MKFHHIVLMASLVLPHTVSAQTESTKSSTNQQGVAAQSPELAEAERLSAEVVKLYGERKYDEALPLAERVLAIREKALGPEHELVAAALHNLAELQLAKRKSKEAEATYQRYLNVYEKVVGADSPKLIEAFDRYVCLLVSVNKRDKALEAQKRLYKLDNGFEYDESVNRPGRDMMKGGLMVGRSINSPKPPYPPEAKYARASGAVVMKITVDEAGKVIAVRTLCGHPLLNEGAEQAIRGALYTPTVVAGQPAKVKGIAIYNFITQ